MTIIILFIIGLSVGSFLNVVIDRLPRNESIICDRSHCDKCKKILAWYDLIPLLSFAYLQGKCRYCNHSLSNQYPAVELITGISFALIASNYSFDLLVVNELFRIIYILIFSSSMIAIFITDLKYRIIPDEVLVFLGFSTLLFIFIFERTQIVPNILSAVISSALFLFLVIITRGRGMGMGDVKYAFLMGLILGIPKIIIGLYTAFLTGGIISIILILLGLKKMKSTIAFGPFLVLGTVVTFFWGNYLWIIARKLMGI